MFSKLLVKLFIKNYTNTQNERVREGYGYLAGTVGIISNLLLFIVKLFVGILSGSIAATADAFNNLSDAASSVITLFSFKMANIPADEEHPFGHARIEYIAALIVSFMAVLVGFEFVKSSFEKILHPVPVTFKLLPFIMILLSILVKLWLSSFNKYIGKTIDSHTLTASSFEAFADVITSSCIALSFLIARWTSHPFDGYLGVLIALFIIYSGFRLVKETLDPLLGEAPDLELVKNLISGVMNYEYISGVHDVIVHNYGPGRCMVSLHAEVPSEISIVKIHEIIDRAERELSEKYRIFLLMHMDPINTNNAEVNSAKQEVLQIIKNYPVISSLHDFRVVGDGENKNLIFDAVVEFKSKLKKHEEEELKLKITNDIKVIHPKYNTVITIDRDYKL